MSIGSLAELIPDLAHGVPRKIGGLSFGYTALIGMFGKPLASELFENARGLAAMKINRGVELNVLSDAWEASLSSNVS
jgi:hypothetical protein